MKILDDGIGELVDVECNDCLNYTCYYPCTDPGVPGWGLGKSTSWLCGTREVHGCPDETEYM